MKKSIKILSFILIALLLLVPILFIQNIINVQAEESIVLDFINQAPSEKTEYVIGNGKVVYEPLENNNFIITLQDVVLRAEHKTNYYTNYTYTALAGTGNVTLVLKGENKVYLHPSTFSTGLLFYDSNVTVTGDGSLFVGFENEEKTNNNATPFDVMGNYDVLNGKEPGTFTDTGNFTLERGTLKLEPLKATGLGALTVHNDIVVNSGALHTNGQTNGIYSVYNDIEISGGNVKCENYSVVGLKARRGDVIISGQDTSVVLQGREGRSTTGICAGDMSHYDTDSVEAGNVQIKEATIDVKSSFIGIFAQHLDSVPNSGNITIESGNITISSVGDSSIMAGILAKMEENKGAGDVLIAGGNISINVENTDVETPDCYSIGIYSDKAIILQGGNVNVSAKGAQNASSYALYCENDLSFNGGNYVLSANTSVLTCAPKLEEKVVMEVSLDESGENIVPYEEDKYGSYKYISFKRVSVDDIIISADNNIVEVGKGVQLSVKIEGENVANSQVMWSISGATSQLTSIDDKGFLTIGEDEEATSITVTATSMIDKNVSKTFVVKISPADNTNYNPADNTNYNLLWGIIIGLIALFVVGCIALSVYFYRKNLF